MPVSFKDAAKIKSWDAWSDRKDAQRLRMNIGTKGEQP